VTDFFTRIGVTEVFSTVNNIELNEREKTYISGKRYLNVLAMSEGILRFVHGCKLTNFTEVIPIDHKGYIIDIDLNSYFKMKTLVFNNMSDMRLNLQSRKQRERLIEKTKELFQTIKIKELIESAQEDISTNFELEHIDKEITYILQSAICSAVVVEYNFLDIPESKY